MEIPLENEHAPKSKLYDAPRLGVGTFLGGPLVATYFFAENYKKLGRQDLVLKSWGIGVLFTIALFAVVFMLPEDLPVPNFVISGGYTLMIVLLFRQVMSRDVDQALSQGSVLFGWGRTILVAVIGLVTTLVLILFTSILIYGVGDLGLTVASKTYGGGVLEIDYDATNLTTQEVDDFAAKCLETGFFDDGIPCYLYIEKHDKTWEVSFAVNSIIQENPNEVEIFREFRKDLDRRMHYETVELKLVVDYLDNVVFHLKPDDDE